MFIRIKDFSWGTTRWQEFHISLKCWNLKDYDGVVRFFWRSKWCSGEVCWPYKYCHNSDKKLDLTYHLRIYLSLDPHYARNTMFTTRKTDYTIIIFEISAFQWYMTFLPSRSPLDNINFIYFLNGKTDTFNFACIFYDTWYSKGKKTILKSCTK